MCKINFIVVDFNSEPILGLNECVRLDLIHRVNTITNKFSHKLPKRKIDIFNMYPSLFQGLGCIPGFVDIKLKDNAIPVVQYDRKIPISLHNKLKLTLEQLNEKNIISKVDYPTDWVNSLMIVEKPNGTLRLCIDPKPLNKYICREHFIIPKCDDIISKLTGKTVFSVIDMEDGFWQLQLNEKSSDYCTFNTPFGRFKFNRVPFGISSAPEIFQKKCFEIFGDIKGVNIYFDDMIIAAVDEIDHDHILKQVLDQAEKFNVKFNFDKFQYRVNKVIFMGQEISESVIKPHNKNIECIKALKTPDNKKDLLKILGMFKFFSKFIPNLSKLTHNMRNLTRNDIPFEWTSNHETELTTLKLLISSKPILSIFNENKATVVQCDASNQELGCALMQEKPISFSSRSLSKTEQKYAQIEKEMLAIVFAFEKFHYFVYGRPVIVQTDHKPLVSIFSKNLDKVSNRLQRMLLKLLKYDIKIEYIPGSQMYVADVLSRFIANQPTADNPDMEYIIHLISNNVPMSDERKHQFRDATNNDKILSQIKNFCETKWPANSKYLSRELKFYYKVRDDIYLSNDLLFLNTKIIVPTTLRLEMLKIIHRAHFGIQKCKLRARQVMYWPKIDNDIEQFITECNICQLNKPANQKETLVPHPIPSRPWQNLSSDFFEYNNQNYLLFVDSYSNWIEVFNTQNKNIETVIYYCKDIFPRFGTPDILYSDNIPYNCTVFKEFANEWNFKLIFSSPHHHQSNGLAEKSVNIVKQMLKKSSNIKELPLLLLDYRNTPLPHMGYSPSQLLLNRILKSKLPITESNLKPELIKPKIISEKFEKKQNNQKHYYNRNAKDLSKLNVNEPIVFQKNKKWKKGIIIGKVNDRSYTIRDIHGNQFRRNRKYINKANMEVNINDDIIYDFDSTNDSNENNLPDTDLNDSDFNIFSNDDVSDCLNQLFRENHTSTTRNRKLPKHLADYILA